MACPLPTPSRRPSPLPPVARSHRSLLRHLDLDREVVGTLIPGSRGSRRALVVLVALLVVGSLVVAHGARTAGVTEVVLVAVAVLVVSARGAQRPMVSTAISGRPGLLAGKFGWIPSQVTMLLTELGAPSPRGPVPGLAALARLTRLSQRLSPPLSTVRL